MKTTTRFVIGLLLLGTAAACSGDKDPTSPDPDPGTITTDVFMPGLGFSPAFITIAVGSNVRFNFDVTIAHDVTFQAKAGAPQSIPVTTGNIGIIRTFAVKGTFPYDCQTHPGMSGSVTVQ